MEKSREATDLANIRAAYAEVMSSALTGETTDDVTENGGAYSKTVTLTQKQNGWVGDNATVKIGGVTVPAGVGEGKTVTVSLAKDATEPTLSVN